MNQRLCVRVGRRGLALVLALMLVLVAVPTGAAGSDLNVSLDGYPLTLSPAPVILAGRTMVSLQALANATGATASLSADGTQGTYTREGIAVDLVAGKTAIRMAGHGDMAIDVAPQAAQGILYVPLRHVLEAVGYRVGWDAATRTVLLTTPSQGTAPPTGAMAPVRPVEISLANFAFSPAQVTVTAGETVRFTIKGDDYPHTFTIRDLNVDVTLAPGQTRTVDVTFDRAGSLQFVCRFHEAAGMVGTIQVVEPAAAASGRAVIRDHAARSDRATVTVAGLMAGDYTVAFRDAAGATVAEGALPVGANDQGSATVDAMNGVNLYKVTEQVTVMQGDQAVLSGSLPQASYAHIRHVLSGDPGGGPGWGVSLMAQAHGALKHAGLAADSTSVTAVRMHADHVYAYLTGGLTGLVSGNANPADNQDTAGYAVRRYATETAKHAGFAAAQSVATAGIKLHNGHVQAAIQNLVGADGQSGWIAAAAAKARAIVEMPYGDVAAAQADVADLKVLVDKVVNGVDANGNGSVDPVAGEGGALTAYLHAQNMGWFDLK